jgi:subtilase family serine protease
VAALANASVTVTNAGDANAGSSIVLVRGVGAFTIPALSPGQSATRTYACKGGTITATADETKLVTESDEGNNDVTRTVTCLGLT